MFSKYTTLKNYNNSIQFRENFINVQNKNNQLYKSLILANNLSLDYINQLRLDYYVHRVNVQPYYLIDKELISEDNICNQKPSLYQTVNKKKCNSYWLKFINDMDKFINIDSLLKQFEYVTYFSDWNYGNIEYNIPTFCKVVTKCKNCRWGSGCNNGINKHLSQFITIPLESPPFYDKNTYLCTGKVKDDIPFSQKDNKLIWRGTNSGIISSAPCKVSRYDLIQKFQKNKDVDIKFNWFSDGLIPKYIKKDTLINGKFIARDKLLKHKIILCIEGNDRASSLYWALTSNSAVMMPLCTTRSWYMEELLKPWVHFIPIKNDLSDLLEKWEWSKSNAKQTEQIAINATKFMRNFLNKNNEMLLIKKILEWYGNNIKFKNISKIKLKNFKNFIF